MKGPVPSEILGIACCGDFRLAFGSNRKRLSGRIEMIAIGACDARTQLPRLLERVRRGERFVITKHGRPVAQLLPTETAGEPDVNQVILQMQEWQERRGPTLGRDLTIGDLREAGRRFERCPKPSVV
jgi:prevent-host-death family protein